MEGAKESRRYRSRNQPACTACRKRKSRCVVDASGQSCLLCRLNGSACQFPRLPVNSGRRPRKSIILSSSRTRQILAKEPSNLVQSSEVHASRQASGNSQLEISRESGDLLTTLGETEKQIAHIVGPAAASDVHVLEDYLSSLLVTDSRAQQSTHPSSYSIYARGSNGPAFYTRTLRQPVGISRPRTPGIDECEIIERIIEPYADDLISM
jgi:hypothetical protein